jgi:hypothetical protein
MGRESNPREISDDALAVLMQHGLCPMCLRELDTKLECEECGFDASLIALQLSDPNDLLLDKDHVEVSNED